MGLIPRRQLLLASLGLLAACAAGPSAAVRAATPTDVAMCAVLTKVSAGTLHGPGPLLSSRLDETLAEHNLTPMPVGADRFGEAFRARRTSQQRLDWLAEAVPDAPLLLLVDAEVEYYTQISGRFRWTVAVKVSVMPRGQPEQLVALDFSVPVALQLQHEREEAALEEASPVVQRQVALALDLLLGGLEAL